MIVATQLGTAQAAEPSVAQLFEIKEILGQNDVAALRTYLEQYPELLEGDTQLAVLLRRFLLDAKHLPNYLLSDTEAGAPEEPADGPAGPAGGPGDGGPDPGDNGIY